MDDYLRYLGCAVGFGFAVVWMTVGLGPAIVCLLLAALGYGAVFVAQRAEANANTSVRPNRTPETDAVHLHPDGFELDHGRYYEPSDDATTPLAAEADYGWPEQRAHDHAAATGHHA